MRDHNTHLIRTECVLGGLPLVVDLPCGLGCEGGEREPVEILVFLKIGKSDEKKAIEGRCGTFEDSVPDLTKGDQKRLGRGRGERVTCWDSWLKRAVLSASLNSSMVLKFLKTPVVRIE